MTLVVNGGSITLSDVQHSLSAGRAVVAAAGTGRAADLLATAARGGASDSTDLAEQVRSAVASGLVSALDATLDADLCRAELSRLLRSR